MKLMMQAIDSSNDSVQRVTLQKPVDGEVDEEEYIKLVDYLEYFTDPAAWFVEKEHPCFDGA